MNPVDERYSRNAPADALRQRFPPTPLAHGGRRRRDGRGGCTALGDGRASDPTSHLRDVQWRASFRNMSREAVLYVEGSEPIPVFRDLERVTIVCAATTDDGQTVPAGSEGTIVDVIKEELAYAVEFSAPVDGLATLLPNELRPLERTEARTINALRARTTF